MRVIIDTNILISGLISKKGAPSKIINAVLQGRLVPVCSQVTLAELADVLLRPHLLIFFQRAGVSPVEFIETFKQLAEMIEVVPQVLQMGDVKDQPFVDLAATVPPPDFIITGDKDFTEKRYFDVPVISATVFVETVL
jgi:hypothetical protein